jgi:hypothetical protein
VILLTIAGAPAANLAVNFALTVLTSGFVSTATFYWLTSGKERREFLRGKLEELSMAYQAYCKLILTIRYLPYRDVITGNLEYNQALDLVV